MNVKPGFKVQYTPFNASCNNWKYAEYIIMLYAYAFPFHGIHNIYRNIMQLVGEGLSNRLMFPSMTIKEPISENLGSL